MDAMSVISLSPSRYYDRSLPLEPGIAVWTTGLVINAVPHRMHNATFIRLCCRSGWQNVALNLTLPSPGIVFMCSSSRRHVGNECGHDVTLPALGFKPVNGVLELADRVGRQHSMEWPRGSQEATTRVGGDLGCFERHYDTAGVVALPAATSSSCLQALAWRHAHAERSRPPPPSPSPPSPRVPPVAAATTRATADTMADASRLFGFLWCVYSMAKHSPRDMLNDFKLSVHAAARLFPQVPRAAYTNLADAVPTMSHNVTWLPAANLSEHLPERANTTGAALQALEGAYAHKLLALMRTPFTRTIFLDNDLFLLKLAFLPAALTISELADVAMPVDPARGALYVPMGCSCLVIYRRTAVKLYERAYQKLLSGEHPPVGRQGDQEMIYFAWREAPTVRLLMLPEEYYCFWNGLSRYWVNAHKTYTCWTLHGHGYTAAKLFALQDDTPPRESDDIPTAATHD